MTGSFAGNEAGRAGLQDFSPALETFERMLLNCEIAHAGHKVLDWCMSNAVIEQDGAENRKLSGEKATGRIDLAVAAVMAAGLINATLNRSPFGKPHDHQRQAASLRCCGRLLPDALMLGGAGGISYGAWLVYGPAGYVVCGLFCLALAWWREA